MTTGLLRDWINPPQVEVPHDFAVEIGGHPLVAQVLVRRGIHDAASARQFLDPDVYIPTPPDALPGMVDACARIERAIHSGEKMYVWGDFDVDGQTSTALLVSALRGLGGNVVYHIPVRARESHGVNIAHLQPILDEGVTLLITCDTGIGAHEALDYARTRSVDVIVTDHHALPEVLPPALALISPRFLPDDHPFSGLPGVGVAYLLAAALYERAGRSAEVDSFLDLAALGIVADLADVRGETRYLLQRGLPVLREARRAGLQVMYELASLQPAWLTEEHVGFIIGPRLNALGRLDDANPAVEFFTTVDLGRARVLATHLEGLNARRRLLTAQVLGGALAQIQKEPDLLEQAALVLAHPEWPAGVIGIVASELSERYNRPTVLLSAPPGQPARGSARSIEGVNITEAIAEQKPLLLGFGGHPMAAGLSLDGAYINSFRSGLSRSVERMLGGAPPRPVLVIDGQISLSDLTLDLVADLERLAPFGPGNPPLVLSVPRLTILSHSTIGREGDHLQVVVKDEQDVTRRVVWWRGAGWPLPEGMFDLACVVRASNFRGQRDVQVEWVDARPVEGEEGVTALRSTLAVIDQRELQHPLPVLRSLLAECESAASIVIWGEAEASERLADAGLQAAGRAQLAPADTLVIWTTPPGRAQLEAALEAVHPRSVVLFAVDPQASSSADFLKRLAGLCKFAIENRSGQASLERLAAATAQREAAVRLGLQWLEQRGMFRAEILPDGDLHITKAQAPGSGSAEIQSRLEILLAETAAYRSYFRSAEKENLL